MIIDHESIPIPQNREAVLEQYKQLHSPQPERMSAGDLPRLIKRLAVAAYELDGGVKKVGPWRGLSVMLGNCR
jgi:hypothetical protein